jgi:hypothetical protein
MCNYHEKESGYNVYSHLQALTPIKGLPPRQQLTVPFCSRTIPTLESLWRWRIAWRGLALHRALDLHEATEQRDLRLLQRLLRQTALPGRSLERSDKFACSL